MQRSALLVVFALLFAACGDEPADDEASAGTPTTRATATHALLHDASPVPTTAVQIPLGEELPIDGRLSLPEQVIEFATDYALRALQADQPHVREVLMFRAPANWPAPVDSPLWLVKLDGDDYYHPDCIDGILTPTTIETRCEGNEVEVVFQAADGTVLGVTIT